jgi:hypothetical protein
MQQALSIKIGWKVMLAMGIYLAALGLFFDSCPASWIRKSVRCIHGKLLD